MSTLVPHRTRDSPQRIASAIYGLIIVTSLLAVYSDDTSKTLIMIAGGIFVTGLVFWLSHVYCALVAERAERGRHPTFAEVRRVSWEHWPLVAATLLPVVVLVLGAAGLGDRSTAIWAAFVFCNVELFLFGLFMERREGGSWPASVISGVIGLSLGLMVIALKALVH